MIDMFLGSKFMINFRAVPALAHQAGNGAEAVRAAAAGGCPATFIKLISMMDGEE